MLARIAVFIALVAFVGCGPPSVPPALQYATVSGRVYDGQTGAGIGGATVTISGVSVTCDASGAYEYSPVPNGPWDIVASAAGYTAVAMSPPPLVPGEKRVLDIALQRG